MVIRCNELVHLCHIAYNLSGDHSICRIFLLGCICPQHVKNMIAVVLPQGLYDSQLRLYRIIRGSRKVHLRISLGETFEDAFILLNPRPHTASDIHRLVCIGRNKARREPRKLIGTHAQRTGGVDGRRVSLQFFKCIKVQGNESDNECEKHQQCGAQSISNNHIYSPKRVTSITSLIIS